MIINTGQRTDIPAFYSEWFANRLKEGFVCVRNPFDGTQVSRYRLDPSVVDADALARAEAKVAKSKENIQEEVGGEGADDLIIPKVNTTAKKTDVYKGKKKQSRKSRKQSK